MQIALLTSLIHLPDKPVKKKFVVCSSPAPRTQFFIAFCIELFSLMRDTCWALQIKKKKKKTRAQKLLHPRFFRLIFWKKEVQFLKSLCVDLLMAYFDREEELWEEKSLFFSFSTVHFETVLSFVRRNSRYRMTSAHKRGVDLDRESYSNSGLDPKISSTIFTARRYPYYFC